MANLPVREMVLYKHGVGFFVRQGQVQGANVALNFRKDEINDVLKSLAVFDQSGGQVLGVHYQTPMDKSARLASSSIRLSERESLRDLIGDLRGRDVELQVQVTPGTVETVSGRMVGLDSVLVDSTPPVLLVNVLTDSGVRVFKLEDVRNLRVLDDQAEHDLAYFLDTSLTEDDRRTVNVRLSDGDHDLVVYYVAPSPTWRVSYRLVAESDETTSDETTEADAPKTTGKALLQGWGLFDNRLEEDLNDVRVTLVAGQPISFIYELYASRIPQRPTVEDESRIAPGPLEFAEGMAMDAMMADEMEEMADFAPQERRRGVAAFGAMAPPPAPRMQRKQMSEASRVETQTKDAGETFQYQVTTPVTVKRGESALVPIIGQDVSYERELLFNERKLPNHPVAALRFVNTTGLTLERGPVTIVEDGDYKGEAVIAFSKADNTVYLPYAVELGVTIRTTSRNYNQTTGLHIEGEMVIFEQYGVNETHYHIHNTTNAAKTITIEQAMQANYDLFDTPTPAVETVEDYRWRVPVNASGRVLHTVKMRRKNTTQARIRQLNYQNLDTYLKERWLSDELHGALRDILDQFQQVQAWQQANKALEQERNEIYQQQEQIRKNLGALQPTGKEAKLRDRLLNDLEQTQNRLDAIAQEVESHKTQITEAEARIQQMIAALTPATQKDDA